jgi:hypothetical protein
MSALETILAPASHNRDNSGYGSRLVASSGQRPALPGARLAGTTWDRFAALLLTMTHLRIPAAEIPPSYASLCSLNNRGRRESRARSRTRSLARKMKKHTSKSPQVLPNNPAFPARRFYGFLRALPGDRALLSPSSLRSVASQELDASVETSGPHDFAVCGKRSRPARPKIAPDAIRIHRVPRPTCRDDRDTPLFYRSTRRANL